MREQLREVAAGSVAPQRARRASAGADDPVAALPAPEFGARLRGTGSAPSTNDGLWRETDQLREPGQIGAFLRREGLYSSTLSRWRAQRARGLLNALASRRRGRRPAESDRLAHLEVQEMTKTLWPLARAGAVSLASIIWAACGPDSPSSPSPASSVGSVPVSQASTDWLEEIDTSAMPGLLAILDEAAIYRVTAMLNDELDPGWRERITHQQQGETDSAMLDYMRGLVEADVRRPLSPAEARYMEHMRELRNAYREQFLADHPEQNVILGKAPGEGDDPSSSPARQTQQFFLPPDTLRFVCDAGVKGDRSVAAEALIPAARVGLARGGVRQLGPRPGVHGSRAPYAMGLYGELTRRAAPE